MSGVGVGLGQATARAVLRGGGSVVLGDIDDAQLATFVSEVDPDGARSAWARCDIGELADCENLAARAGEKFGRLDAVVHVAARSDQVGGLLDGDLDNWDDVARVNVKGTLQLTKAVMPLLTASASPAIIFVGSIAAIHSVAGIPQLAYGMSKAALVTATHYLARELGPRGIRVNTVSPGWKWGAQLEQAITDRAASLGVDTQTFMAPVIEGHPLRRVSNDEEVSNTIAFFCSDLAPSITGQVLYVDAGLTA